MSDRTLGRFSSPGHAAQIIPRNEAYGLRYAEVMAAFWPRQTIQTKRLTGSRLESVDAINPSLIWRTIPLGSGIVTLNTSLTRNSVFMRIADGATADMRLYDRDTGREAVLGFNPRRYGGFSIVQAIRYQEDAFARAGSVGDGTRYVFWGPRNLGADRFYTGYNATTTDFLLMGGQAAYNGMHVVWISVDYNSGTLTAGADTLRTDLPSLVKSKSVALTDLPRVIDYLTIAHLRSGGRIDDCYIGPTVFLSAPIATETNRALREDVISAVASAAGVSLLTS